MRRVWVKAVPWIKQVVLAALECGADALRVPTGWESHFIKRR